MIDQHDQYWFCELQTAQGCNSVINLPLWTRDAYNRALEGAETTTLRHPSVTVESVAALGVCFAGFHSTCILIGSAQLGQA